MDREKVEDADMATQEYTALARWLANHLSPENWFRLILWRHTNAPDSWGWGRA